MEKSAGRTDKKIKNPYLSIIIPVYNVEQYLKKCLESVLNQTYQEFECILVDDGSTDASGRICDEFAISDSRITVIHKENGGLVSVRKAGLKNASGRFIGCVDSDDWVEPDYFEKLLKMQKKYDADIVAGNLFRDIGEDSYPVYNRIPTGLYRKQDILPQLIYSGNFFEFGLHPSLCSKLIRKEILDITQLSVDEDILEGEDDAVVYPSVLVAEKILVTDICGYHYVQRQGSITKSVKQDDLRRLQLVFDHLEKTFRTKGVMNELEFQVNQWKKFILLERHIQVFDEKTDGDILSPYGGIPLHSRIVIYGASFMGQTINRYITKLEENTVQKVLWIDKEHQNFEKQGLQVEPPEHILNLHDRFDVVLIASVTESIVCSMKDYLLKLNVPEYKIRWLSEDFINNVCEI